MIKFSSSTTTILFAAQILAVVGAAGNMTQGALFSGLNIPWNRFGYDIGGGAYDADYFETYFAAAEAGGQNAARFWVHCDGRNSPTFDEDTRMVTGLPLGFSEDLQDLVARALNHRIVLQLALWSFDMCKTEVSSVPRTDLISDRVKAQSYVDNALNPMLALLQEVVAQSNAQSNAQGNTQGNTLGSAQSNVQGNAQGNALGGSTSYAAPTSSPSSPRSSSSSTTSIGAVVIEVINEPEWCMAGSCGAGVSDCVGVESMQGFVALQAAAARDAGFKVTVGSASLKWDASGGSGEGKFWADAPLKAAYKTYRNDSSSDSGSNGRLSAAAAAAAALRSPFSGSSGSRSANVTSATADAAPISATTTAQTAAETTTYLLPYLVLSTAAASAAAASAAGAGAVTGAAGGGAAGAKALATTPTSTREKSTDETSVKAAEALVGALSDGVADGDGVSESTAGTLHLFNVHYYDWMHDSSWGYDPARPGATVEYWGLTGKPVVVGELPANSDYYNTTEMVHGAIANGFFGDLFWADSGADDGFPIDAALPVLQSLTSEHPTETSYETLVSFIEGL